MTGSNRKKLQISARVKSRSDSSTQRLEPQKNKKSNIGLALTKKEKISDSNIIVDVLGLKKERFISAPSLGQKENSNATPMLIDEKTEKGSGGKNQQLRLKENSQIDGEIFALSEISLISPRNTERLMQDRHQLSDADLLRMKQSLYRLLQVQNELYDYLKKDKVSPFSKKTREILMSLKLNIFNQYHRLMIQVFNRESTAGLDFSNNFVSDLISRVQKNKKKNNCSDRTQGFFDRIQKINSETIPSGSISILELNQKLLLRSVDDIFDPLLEFGKTRSPIKNFEKRKDQYICLDFIDLFNKIKGKVSILSHEKSLLEIPLLYDEIAREVYFVLLKYRYIPYQERAPKHIQDIISRYIEKMESLGMHEAFDTSIESLIERYSLKKIKKRNVLQGESKPGRGWSNSLSEEYPDIASNFFPENQSKGKHISEMSINVRYQVLFHNLMRVVDYYEKGALGQILAFELGIEENKKNYWSEQIKIIKDFLINAYLNHRYDASALINCVRGAAFDIRKSIGGKDSRLAGTLEDFLEDYQEKTDIGKALFAKSKLPDKLKVGTSSEVECMLYMENHLLHQLSEIFLGYLDEVDARVLGSSNDFKIKATLFLNQVVHALLREADLDARQNQLNILMEGDYVRDKSLSKSEQFKLGMKQLLEFSIKKFTPMKDIAHLDSGGFSKMIKDSLLIFNLFEAKPGFKLNI